MTIQTMLTVLTLALPGEPPTVLLSWQQSHPAGVDGGVSAGVAFGDIDGDGWEDLYITNINQPNHLYRNHAGRFQRVAGGAPVEDAFKSSGAVFADIDNDGDLDLFVTNQGNQHNNLYRNDGSGAFARVHTGDLVSDFGESYSSAFADFDNDGHLDLAVANAGQTDFVYRNRGNGTFQRITGPWSQYQDQSFGVSWADYDDDGDADLLVANYDSSGGRLYRNLGDGRFETIDLAATGVLNRPYAAASWGDIDGDGDLDLYLASSVGFFRPSADALLLNDNGALTPAPWHVATDSTGTSASWVDGDNDGDLDLLVADYVAPNRYYENRGGRLHPSPDSIPHNYSFFASGHAWADYDRDGDQDLVVANWENLDNGVYRNDSPAVGQWLEVRLVGVRSNRFGIGARLIAKVGDAQLRRDIGTSTGFRGQSPSAAWFGLGSADQVTRLTVRWPSGQEETLEDIPGGQTIVITEGRGITERRTPPVNPQQALRDYIETHGTDRLADYAAGLHGKNAAGPTAASEDLVGLAIEYYREDQPDIAIALLRTAAAQYPQAAGPIATLGRIHELQGQPDQALQLYRSAADRLRNSSDPRAAAVLNRLGYLEKFGAD